MPYRRGEKAFSWESIGTEEDALQERGHHVYHKVGIEEDALQERETHSIGIDRH